MQNAWENYVSAILAVALVVSFVTPGISQAKKSSSEKQQIKK